MREFAAVFGDSPARRRSLAPPIGLAVASLLVLVFIPSPLMTPLALLGVGATAYDVSRRLARESRRGRIAAAAAACAADLLEHSTRRLHALLDSLTDPLLLVGEDGRIQAAGSAIQALLGWAPHTLYERAIFDLMPDLDPSCFRSNPEAKAENTRWSGELEVARADGDRRACEVTIYPMPLRSSERHVDELLYLLQLRDQTELRIREVARLHANKMESIGQLATGIAHEINTPCQYVGDNLRFLERCVARMSEAAAEDATAVPAALARDLAQRAPEAIQEALEGVERIASIVSTMRQLAYPHRPGRAQAFCPLDLNVVVRESLTLTRNQWQPHAEVETDLQEPLPEIQAIPGELHQVVLNLIVNAAHAIEARAEPQEPGHITIRTQLIRERVCLEISDNGVGIPSEIQRRIFDPFFTTKAPGRGTGQGLAICDAIVRRHQGSIECHSVSGSGTRFRVEIPTEDTSAVHPSD